MLIKTLIVIPLLVGAFFLGQWTMNNRIDFERLRVLSQEKLSEWMRNETIQPWIKQAGLSTYLPQVSAPKPVSALVKAKEAPEKNPEKITEKKVSEAPKVGKVLPNKTAVAAPPQKISFIKSKTKKEKDEEGISPTDRDALIDLLE